LLLHADMFSALRISILGISAACLLMACAGPGGRAVVIDKSYQGQKATRVPPGAYFVQPGDTVYGIAQRNGISTRSLIDWNGLRPPYNLLVGQSLRLPQSQSYVVQRGDSLYVISRRFGADMARLAQANNLREPYMIREGQLLTLPSGMVPAMVQNRTNVPPPSSASWERVATTSLPNVKRSGSIRKEPFVRFPDPPASAGNGFVWPVEGRVVSRFGAKGDGLFNDGMNIAAPRGAPVRAVDNGIVAYAGKEIRGFGNLLLIKHEDGLITAYAHNEALLVARGDKVSRGQVIAKVGTSGGVESPQLHFEVRKGTRAVDPSAYLPG
jgi:murein DD-endopeptidase MepM/ murein hydrolase activator NlpD